MSADMRPFLVSSQLFASLSRRPWQLRRTLRSDNPADINGELTGVATFRPLSGNDPNTELQHNEMLYKEEGEMPSSVRGMAGLRWSKKYIWRLHDHDHNKTASTEQQSEGSKGEEQVPGEISVWFVKVQPGEEQADYLFHEFDFGTSTQTCGDGTGDELIEPPVPPAATGPAQGIAVVKARGNHLCIKDMYRTAYAFRIVAETGEVLSWASRHVVKGPKKNQDIVNLYS